MKLFVFLTLVLGFVSAVGDLTIATTSGTYTGIVVGNHREFRGIPYAHPPIGANLFAKTTPFESTGSFDADEFGPACPQTNPQLLPRVYPPVSYSEMSLNCTNINVYAPLEDVENAGIFFHLTPGGLLSGQGTSRFWKPEVFTDNGQIFITFDAPVNLVGYGFLPGSVPNTGFEYTRTAQRWAQLNGAAFGGDVSTIVDVGQSGGGANIVHQVVNSGLDDGSTLSEYGVSAVWYSSASPVIDYTLENIAGKTYAAAAALGCTNPETVLQCMRDFSQYYPSVFVAAIADPQNAALINSFGPAYGEGSQFPDSVLNMIHDGAYDPAVNHVAIIMRDDGWGLRYVASGLGDYPLQASGVDPISDAVVAQLQAIANSLPAPFGNQSVITVDGTDLSFVGMLVGAGVAYPTLAAEETIFVVGAYEGFRIANGMNRIETLDLIISDGNFYCPFEIYTTSFSKKSKVYRAVFDHAGDYPVYSNIDVSSHGIDQPYFFNNTQAGLFPVVTAFSSSEITFNNEYHGYLTSLQEINRPTQQVSQWARFRKIIRTQMILTPSGSQTELAPLAPLLRCLVWNGILLPQ